MAAASTLPRVSDVLRDASQRLIPWRYSDPEERGPEKISRDDSVLTRLTDDIAELCALFELEGATNDRLLGEAGLLPGITLRELVFGLLYSHVVNAAFTHPNPAGSRFNGPERGAWYAAFARSTAELEMAYHRGKELKEINWQERETFKYVDFLADFRGQFHDIRNDRRFRNCLDPNSYITSQQVATRLLGQGSAGIIYQSARHKSGTCIACFRPALVNNVRKGATISIQFANAFAKPEIRAIK